MDTMALMPDHLSFAQLREIWQQPIKLSLDAEAIDATNASITYINDIVAEDRTAYGTNTGFGLLVQIRIVTGDLQSLQRSLMLSHAAGVGKVLDDAMVRLIIVLKIDSLARSLSGIRLSAIEASIALANAEVCPLIPARGLVSVSGGLASLAYTSLTLLGEGKVRQRGGWFPATDALRKAGLEPITLEVKEGLALLNGTQIFTTSALRGLFEAQELFVSVVVYGALTTEAVLDSRRPFDARIHAARGQRRQTGATTLYRHVLTDTSVFSQSHHNCEKVQDPYSLCYQSQVVGACLIQICQTMDTLLVGANMVSDSPLAFAEEGDVIPGGNFHAESVVMAIGSLMLAIAEVGSLSERRIVLTMNRHISQLPSFLIKNGGVNSSFMIAQVTAAALAGENKALVYLHNVDSSPTSTNQKDYVSTAPVARRRLWEVVTNTYGVIAVGWLAMCQGIDLCEELTSNSLLKQARQALREQVAHYTQDHFFASNVECATEPLVQGTLLQLLPEFLQKTA